MTVNIENEYGQINVPDFENVIENVVEEAITFVKCPFQCEVNVLLTSNDVIKDINMEQRGIDAPTDVLSFPLIEYEEAGTFKHIQDTFEFMNPETGELSLGDIVVSMDKVYEQAKAYNHSNTRELAFLVAHSMLHLFGYDHMDDSERENMEKMQEEILRKRGYTRDYEEV